MPQLLIELMSPSCDSANVLISARAVNSSFEFFKIILAGGPVNAAWLLGDESSLLCILCDCILLVV